MVNAGDLIEGYFPAIVSRDLYDRARLATSRRLSRTPGRRPRAYTNLVPRLGRCATCGGKLDHSESKPGFPYLRCVNSRYGDCSNNRGFPYQKLESVLLTLDQLMEATAGLIPEQFRHEAAVRRMLALERMIARKKKAVRQMMTAFIGRTGAATGAVMKQVEDFGTEIGHHEIELIEARQEARRTEPHERQGFLTRFNMAKARIAAIDLNERTDGRAALAAAFRRLIEGVVLHPNRTVTVHTKPDAPNNGTTYVINSEGLEGVHIRLTDGRTGFIGPSLLLDKFLKPDTRRSNNRQKSRNWQTVAVAPGPMAEIVGNGQRVLASKGSSRIKPRG